MGKGTYPFVVRLRVVELKIKSLFFQSLFSLECSSGEASEWSPQPGRRSLRYSCYYSIIIIMLVVVVLLFCYHSSYSIITVIILLLLFLLHLLSPLRMAQKCPHLLVHGGEIGINELLSIYLFISIEADSAEGR
jgi:hypothetical protein